MQRSAPAGSAHSGAAVLRPLPNVSTRPPHALVAQPLDLQQVCAERSACLPTGIAHSCARTHARFTRPCARVTTRGRTRRHARAHERKPAAQTCGRTVDKTAQEHTAAHAGSHAVQPVAVWPLSVCARKSRGRNVLRWRGSWMRWSALSSHAKRQCRSRRSRGWAHPTPTPGNGTGPAVPTSAPGTGCKAAVSKRKRRSAVVPTTAQSPRGAISHPALVTDYGGALSATVRWRMCAVPHCSHGRTRPWRRSVRKCGQGAA